MNDNIASDPASRSNAVLVGSQQWDQTAANGRTYRIFVSQPLLPPPPEGYPVVYLPDANGTFGTATEQATLRSLGGEIKPGLIVGIGYPIDSMSDALNQRMLDLTPPAPPEKISPRFAASEIGGSEAFLHFILNELTPQLSSAYPIDASNRSLIGFSLGGLFVLHTLFQHSQSFSNYVAGSPSIWWNDSALLANEHTFAAALEGGAKTRVLITAGGLEQSLDHVTTPPGYTREQALDLVSNARMVDNARELAARLATHASQSDQIKFALFEEETHASVLPATISRGLGFALRP